MPVSSCLAGRHGTATGCRGCDILWPCEFPILRLMTTPAGSEIGNMRRREFIVLLGGAALTPSSTQAQQAKPTIGFINGTSAQQYAPYVAAFRDGLKESGFIEGENVAIEYRWGEGD